MKTNTKALFIQTASNLFATKGYNATGISEILKTSGAPKGSLYYYFPQGKEQLADEALQVLAREIFADIKSSLAKYDDPMKGFQDHLRLIAAKIESDTFKPNISISLMALETFSFSDKLTKRCEYIFTEIQQIYMDKLIASGIAKPSAKILAMTLIALTEGMITLCLTQRSVEPLLSLADNLPKLLIFK